MLSLMEAQALFFQQGYQSLTELESYRKQLSEEVRNVSVCLSIHPSIYLSIYLSIYQLICMSKACKATWTHDWKKRKERKSVKYQLGQMQVLLWGGNISNWSCCKVKKIRSVKFELKKRTEGLLTGMWWYIQRSHDGPSWQEVFCQSEQQQETVCITHGYCVCWQTLLCLQNCKIAWKTAQNFSRV